MGTDRGRLFQRLFEPRHQGDETEFGGASAKWGRVVLIVCFALGFTGFGPLSEASADDVRGKIVFKPDKLGSSPVRSKGFIKRIENPLRPVRKFNPRPYMIVVLDGGTVADEAKKPPAALQKYRLKGESFATHLFPVIVGSRVELVNESPRQAKLFTPEDPDLVDATLNPRGSAEFKVKAANQVTVIRSQDSDHLAGRVVAFAHRYFSTVDRRGKFEIKDVPEGNWKVKVWYRDGYIDGFEQSIEVRKRKATDVDLTITPDKVRTANK